MRPAEASRVIGVRFVTIGAGSILDRASVWKAAVWTEAATTIDARVSGDLIISVVKCVLNKKRTGNLTFRQPVAWYSTP